MTKIKTVYICS